MDYHILPTSIDIVCVTETWFKKSIVDNQYCLQNYSLMRRDRVTGNRGGGIAIYYKKRLNLTLVMISDDDDNVEFMGVEIKAKTPQKCLLVCVYNPHKTNNIQPFFEKLSDIVIKYDKIVVCGDFNINLLYNGPSIKAFKNNIVSCGLHVINQNPTRFAPNSTPALLDIIMCSNPSLTLHFDQLCLGGISDHDLLFYVLDFNTDISLSTTIIFRDFKSINMENSNSSRTKSTMTNMYLLKVLHLKIPVHNGLIKM